MRTLLATATMAAVVAAALAGCGDKKVIGGNQPPMTYAAPATTTAGIGRAGNISQEGMTIVIAGYTAMAIAADPLLPGASRADLFGGLSKPADQDGAVRPLVAGGYPGGPGWDIGNSVPESLLGSFTDGAIHAPLNVKDSGGNGGNVAFAIRKDGKWLLAGWSDSSGPTNATKYYSGTKFFWADGKLTVQ